MNALRNIMKILALICLVNLCLINAQEAATEGLIEITQQEGALTNLSGDEDSEKRFLRMCIGVNAPCKTDNACCSRRCAPQSMCL